MTIHWPFLLLAVALLLPPLPISESLRRALLKVRSLPSAMGAVRFWQNWVDFVRAGLGVYLLSEWAITVDPAQSGAELRALALKGVILAVVLLAQTVRLVRTVQILAPLFYLSGLTIVLGDYLQGCFAVAVGWLFAIGGKNLTYQMPAMAISLAVAGYVLGLDTPLLLDCVLIFLPLVLSLLFRKRLLFLATPPIVG
jgi:hypothetical protein